MRTDAELRFEKYINPVWSLYVVSLLHDALAYYAKDVGHHTLGYSSTRCHDRLVQDIVSKEIALDYNVVDTLLYGKKTNHHTLYKIILSDL